MKPIIVALACLALVACGDSNSLSGTYSGQGGAVKLVFQSGGTVSVTMMGQTQQGTYKVDGKQVAITVEGFQQTFAIGSDGCIDAGGGQFGKLCKG